MADGGWAVRHPALARFLVAFGVLAMTALVAVAAVALLIDVAPGAAKLVAVVVMGGGVYASGKAANHVAVRPGRR